MIDSKSGIGLVVAIQGDGGVGDQRAALRREGLLEGGHALGNAAVRRGGELQLLALRLDFGDSIFLDMPVTQALGERAQPTILLTTYALLIEILIGVPCGVITAIRHNSFLDRWLMVMSIAGAAIPGSIGFQTVAGASVSASATLRGPVRRSRYCASDCRHESAACCRSAAVIVTCISFSASANVAAVTAGPEPAPVPNVGGAPGVPAAGVDCEAGVGVSLLHAAAVTRKPSGARIRN